MGVGDALARRAHVSDRRESFGEREVWLTAPGGKGMAEGQMNGGKQHCQYQTPAQPPAGFGGAAPPGPPFPAGSPLYTPTGYYPIPPRRRSTVRLWWLLGALFTVTVSGPKDEKLAHVPPPQRWRHRTEQMAERLRAGEQWQDRGLVFTTELGSPVDPRTLLRTIETAAAKAGIEDVGVHTLRHSAAVAWLESGVHIKAVADLLGHSSIAITGDVYGHTSDDTARAAVDGLAGRLGL
jgi:Phage integrase family